MHLVGVAHDGQAPVCAVDPPESVCLDMVCGCRLHLEMSTWLLHMNFWLGVAGPGYRGLRGGKSGLIIRGGLGRHEGKDWVGIGV